MENIKGGDWRKRLDVVNTIPLDGAVCDRMRLVASNLSYFTQLSLQYHPTRDGIFARQQDSFSLGVVFFGEIQLLPWSQLPLDIITASHGFLVLHKVLYSPWHCI